jgi:predicted nucleic acid-binding protein
VSAYILDASVAAKWFLPHISEPLAEESLGLLNQYSQGKAQFFVPDLFWPELGNVLWKAARLGRISTKSAEEAIGSLLKLNIPTSPSAPLLPDAFSIAVNFQRTVYDSIYVAMAVLSNRPLLTADERLANALAAHFPVRWLGSLV